MSITNEILQLIRYSIVVCGVTKTLTKLSRRGGILEILEDKGFLEDYINSITLTINEFVSF
jgi:hypothetical protein